MIAYIYGNPRTSTAFEIKVAAIIHKHDDCKGIMTTAQRRSRDIGSLDVPRAWLSRQREYWRMVTLSDIARLPEHFTRHDLAQLRGTGKVHNAVTRVERQGYIRLVAKGAGRTRNTYTMTDKGRAELAWLVASQEDAP